jgi:ketosteroid isomerase-like protein
MPPTLNAAIEQSHRALAAILHGDPKVYQELYADREDITLGNPFGPYARGIQNVAATLANAAARYKDGEGVEFELVAKYVSDSLACVVEVERGRAKVGGASELANVAVRVTSVFERINGDWRLVHRHADPITSPRESNSVIAQ